MEIAAMSVHTNSVEKHCQDLADFVLSRNHFSKEELNIVIGRIIAKAWLDSEFSQELVERPIDVLERFGIVVEDREVVVFEEGKEGKELPEIAQNSVDANPCHSLLFVIPEKPCIEFGDDLSSNDSSLYKLSNVRCGDPPCKGCGSGCRV